MREKVVIPKEIAADIEALRSKGACADRYLLSLAFKFTFGEEGWALHNYAGENYDTYVNAIVNGYTVAQTPEEKVRKFYDDHKHDFDLSDENDQTYAYCDGVMNGIKYALESYGIKIEGVNA
jgi:hypothetical protein